MKYVLMNDEAMGHALSSRIGLKNLMSNKSYR